MEKKGISVVVAGVFGCQKGRREGSLETQGVSVSRIRGGTSTFGGDTATEKEIKTGKLVC